MNSVHSCNEFDRDVLRIIMVHPGSTGFQIHQNLIEGYKSRRRCGPLWAALFGPSSGKMYVSLAKLERLDLVTSWWGVATPERGGHRPRHYQCI